MPTLFRTRDSTQTTLPTCFTSTTQKSQGQAFIKHANTPLCKRPVRTLGWPVKISRSAKQQILFWWLRGVRTSQSTSLVSKPSTAGLFEVLSFEIFEHSSTPSHSPLGYGYINEFIHNGLKPSRSMQRQLVALGASHEEAWRRQVWARLQHGL